MPVELPVCPFLPEAPASMDWKDMNKHRDDRGPEFYQTCLTYAQFLWSKTLAARAMLCLDRAMGIDLEPNEPVLQNWPLPYAAMAWFMVHTPPEIFIGNPRVHFQHYADRLGDPRKEQRKWRAWACWALARRLRPEWPADPKHQVEEPLEGHILQKLQLHGHSGEAEFWHGVAELCRDGFFDSANFLKKMNKDH